MSATVVESHGPAEARYQLPEGTYRELILKLWLTTFVRNRLTAMRDPNEARLQHHSAEQARVKAAELADREVAAGRPIVVQAWQVESHAHRDAAAPTWLTTSATATVRVFADDTSEPAKL